MAYELTTPADLDTVRTALGVRKTHLLGCAFGDSITAQAASGTNLIGVGYISWMRNFARQRINIPASYCKGVGGETLEQVVARMKTEIPNLPVKPDFCIVAAGTNAGSANIRTVFADAINWLNARNILPVIPAIPAFTIAPSAAGRRYQIDTNRWLRSIAEGHPAARDAAGIDKFAQMVFSNANRFITDYTSATGGCLPRMTADDLHPSPAGSYYQGRELAKAVLGYYGMFQIENDAELLDQYFAGTPGASPASPNGNLYLGTVGVMQGTGGTNVSSASAGLTFTNNGIATGLEFSRGTGNSTMSITFSKIPRDDGSNGDRQGLELTSQVQAASSPAAYDRMRFKMQIAAGKLVAGDWYYAEIEYELFAGSANLMAIELAANADNDVGVDGKYSGGMMEQVAHRGYLRSSPTQYTGSSTVNSHIAFYTKGNADGAKFKIALDKAKAVKCGQYY